MALVVKPWVGDCTAEEVEKPVKSWKLSRSRVRKSWDNIQRGIAFSACSYL